MSSLASPSTRAKAALLHPTSSPQQVIRRLEIEHSKVPFTPRTEEAVSDLMHCALEDSPEHKRYIQALEDWLKTLIGSRSLRIYITQMQEADAHHQRVLAEQEKAEKRARYEKMIKKQRDANKRLQASYDEMLNRRAGEARKRKRAKIAKRAAKDPRKRVIMVGRRAAARGA